MSAPKSSPAVSAVAIPAAADPRALWTLLLFTMLYTVMILDRQVANLVMESIRKDLKLNDMSVALITGFGFSVCQTVLGLPAAWWADRGGRRVVIAAAAVFWSLMTITCGFTRTAWQLALARVGVGAGESISPVFHASLADLYPKNRRAGVLSVLTLGSPLAALLAFPLVGWLDRTYGWRMAFAAAGAPGLILAALVYLTMRDKVRAARTKTEIEAKFGDVIRYIFTVRTFVLSTSGYVISQFGVLGFNGWAPTFLRRVHHMSPAEMGAAFGASTGILGLIGGILGAVVLDRTNRLGDQWKALWPAIATVLFIPCMLVTATAPESTWAVLGMGGVAFLSAFKYGPSLAITVNVMPAGMRAVASSLQGFVAAFIAIGLGPVFIGWLDDALAPRFGQEAMRYSFAFATLFVAIGAALIFLSARTICADIAAVETPSEAA
jgi:MFS family permease